MSSMPDDSEVILKRDPVLGTYTNVLATESQGLHEFLTDAGIRFEVNPIRAARLIESGSITFLFGAQHPQGILDALLDYNFAVAIDSSVVLTETTYAPPVSQLLTLGDPGFDNMQFDYGAHGMSHQDVPELIRMTL